MSSIRPFVITIIGLVAPVLFGAEGDKFVRSKDGSGLLAEKLIVIRSGPIVKGYNESDPKVASPPEPFSVFWRLKTGTPGDEKDGFYLAGSPEGDPVCWLKKEDVQPWTTRFMLDPIPPAIDKAFTVFEDAVAETKVIHFVGDKGMVPEGCRRIAIITGPPAIAAEDDSNTFPVLCFTAEFKGDPGMSSGLDKTNLGLEVVFVIGSTGGAQPLVALAKDLLKQTRLTLSGLPALSEAVRFGVVEYRDENEEFISRTSQPLTSDLDKVEAVLNKIECKGGGDRSDAVTTGIKTALGDEPGWTQNSAKHILLLGDAPNKDSLGPSIDDIIKEANFASESTQQRALGARTIHAVIAFRDELVQTKADGEFQQLTRLDTPGHFQKMNVRSIADHNSLVQHFTEDLQSNIAKLAFLRELKVPETSPIEPKPMLASLTRIVEASRGPDGDRGAHRGYARTHDANGNRVATIKVLMTKTELSTLRDGLIRLLGELKLLKRGQGDISKFTTNARQVIVAALTGDAGMRTDAELSNIIAKDLPMTTKFLRLTDAELAIKEPAEIEALIEEVESARKKVADLCDLPHEILFLDVTDLP